MKKFLSIFMAVCIAVSASLSVCAAEAGEESDGYNSLPVWSDGEEISEEFYARTEAVAAAAIVNTDSFVDKVADQTNFDVPCKAALLMDEGTGQILYAKNADEQLPIASITKVMTMLLVFEAIDAGRISVVWVVIRLTLPW